MSDLTQVILAFACLLNAAAVMGLVRRVKALESKPKQSASRRERIIDNVLAFLCALMIGALMVATVIVSALIDGLS